MLLFLWRLSYLWWPTAATTSPWKRSPDLYYGRHRNAFCYFSHKRKSKLCPKICSFVQLNAFKRKHRKLIAWLVNTYGEIAWFYLLHSRKSAFTPLTRSLCHFARRWAERCAECAELFMASWTRCVQLGHRSPFISAFIAVKWLASSLMRSFDDWYAWINAGNGAPAYASTLRRYVSDCIRSCHQLNALELLLRALRNGHKLCTNTSQQTNSCSHQQHKLTCASTPVNKQTVCSHQQPPFNKYLIRFSSDKCKWGVHQNMLFLEG